MTKLRLQFLFFFLLLQLGIFFLLSNSYRQMRIEEKSLWDAESTKVYNQIQLEISDLLNLEDARSFKDYRFYQSQGADSSARSALSDLVNPRLPKGFLGYFQLDPDGSFSTPYLPQENQKSLPDYSLRIAKQNELEKTTAAFRKEMQGALVERVVPKPTPMPNAGPPSVAGGFNQPLPQKPKSSANIYPNPLVEQKQRKSLDVEEGAQKMAAPASIASAQLARREEAAADDSVKMFEQVQNSKSESSDQEFKLQKSAPKKESLRAEKPLAPRESAKSPVLQEPSPAKYRSSVVWLDPFQAKVSGEFLIFFRRVWVDQKMYLQGFAMNTQKFFEGLMQNSFENSTLPEFSGVRWLSDNQLIAQYGKIESKQHILFWRSMAYPLNSIRWILMGEAWPKISTRLYLNLLSAGLFLFSTIGLFWIYRSSAAHIRLSQKRQDFVSAVSHELKTPLTSIRMYSEMLEDDWVKDETKKKEYYQNIHQESERLSRLIENVLQMARLEKHSYSPHLIYQSPEADLRHWASQFAALCKKEGFEFRLSLENPLPPIHYDSETLKEVLLILLENSIKFSRHAEKKLLELIVKKEGNFLSLIWRDYGPGVPAQDLKHIFEKFYRVENELTRKTKGTGIGLAIAKMTIESMKANIEAKNRENGFDVLLKFPIS